MFPDLHGQRDSLLKKLSRLNLDMKKILRAHHNRAVAVFVTFNNIQDCQVGSVPAPIPPTLVFGSGLLVRAQGQLVESSVFEEVETLPRPAPSRSSAGGIRSLTCGVLVHYCLSWPDACDEHLLGELAVQRSSPIPTANHHHHDRRFVAHGSVLFSLPPPWNLFQYFFLKFFLDDGVVFSPPRCPVLTLHRLLLSHSGHPWSPKKCHSRQRCPLTLILCHV